MAGCPLKAACKPVESKEILKYFLPGKVHNSSKKSHLLKYNTSKGQLNAGK